MATTVIRNMNGAISCVTLSIPQGSTLPITYNVQNVTSDMNVVRVSIDDAHVFSTLTATIGTGTITIDGTRWGSYDDDVSIDLYLARTIPLTATTT